MEGLPNSEGKYVIMVVVDRFTKYEHFIPRKHPFTAINIAQLFFSDVYKLHGIPKRIVSDRDKVFTSSFGLNCSNYWDLNSLLVEPTVLKLMVKQRGSTNVWKYIFSVCATRDPKNCTSQTSPSQTFNPGHTELIL